MSQPEVIQLFSQMYSTCMTCEQPIRKGDQIWWCPGVGAWHWDCDKPRSLQTLWDEAQKRIALGSGRLMRKSKL